MANDFLNVMDDDAKVGNQHTLYIESTHYVKSFYFKRAIIYTGLFCQFIFVARISNQSYY